MRTAQRHPRHAFTLVETLLVLAIILIAAALAFPAIQGMLEDARETAAGDMMRGKAAETRARAMQTGKAWRLAYLPNTGIVQIAPDDADDWNNTGDQSPTEKDELIRDELPKDIIVMTTTTTTSSDMQGTPTTSGAGSGWQTIAVYLYDGSARDDTITHFGRKDEPPMGLQIRALTGSAALLSAKEVKDLQP